MSDPILEKLKKAIAACPDLSGKMAGVFTNYIQEDEPCCGIFPAGEKRLSVDWAGNERWQYDFTIQMAGFAFQETERMENEITAECLSRWLSENGAEILILGEREHLESIWSGQGRLLYPAQDGQTFVYEMPGQLVYWRKGAKTVPRQRWLFAFGPAEEAVWLECAAGMENIEEKAGKSSYFLDWEGRTKRVESAFGAVVFSGQLFPEDPFQKNALLQNPEQKVRWVCCSGKEAEESFPAVGGFCSLQVERVFGAEEQGRSGIRIQMQPLSREKGCFYEDTAGNRFFLAEKTGDLEGLFGRE